MLYLLFGENSFEAAKKIQEIKKAFLNKSSHFLFEEVNSDEESALDPEIFFKNQSLFSQKRLLVFKNAVSKIQNPQNFFLTHSDFLKNSEDIFLFWEKNFTEDGVFEILKKISEKTQEIKSEKTAVVQKNNAVFQIADKIFSSSGTKSLLHLENIRSYGVDGRSLINVVFWKIKKMQKKELRDLDIAHKAIIADLNLKMDSKNEHEHLSRLAISAASRV